MNYRLLLYVALAFAAAGLGASAQTTPTTLTAKVVETKTPLQCDSYPSGPVCYRMLQIRAQVDGHTYWLEAPKAKNGLLELGSYQVRMDKEERKKPYMYTRSYDFLFPNGDSLKFDVVGEIQ